MRFFLGLLLSFNIYANLELAPPAFITLDGDQAVFIDMISNNARLIFHSEYIEIESEFTFKTKENGYPLFDLVNDIDSVVLNGKKVDQKLINLPGKNIPMRIILSEVNPNIEHIATIKFRFNPSKDRPELILRKDRFAFYFKFCDGKGVRQLLERYLPSNLQYDQFKLTLDLHFAKQFPEQLILANGDVQRVNQFHYVVRYPEFYNAGSFYLQSVHESQDIDILNYKGITFTLLYGKINKVLLPSKLVFINAIKKHIDDLQERFGTFPHKKMIIYFGENFSGIEHFGATRTSRYSLGHELFHMYFGRAAMPADGRSAWIDEGLARWADGGSWKEWLTSPFRKNKFIPFQKSMALDKRFIGIKNQSSYQRQTYDLNNLIVDPYEQGRYFFSYLHYLMSDQIFDFLESFHLKFFGKLYTQEDFFEELINFNESDEIKDEIKELEMKYFK